MRVRTLSLATLACLGLLAANGCPPQTIQEAKLLASDGTRWDLFGISISVSGDVAVVGAYGDDDNGHYSGSAYVYRFDGTDWVEEAKLLASDGAAEDYFGISVSVSGDVAVVGAWYDADNGDQAGSAYVYRFDGTDWIEEAKLLASDGTRSDLFGISVSVSGDVAVVGAEGDDDNGHYAGSAYVYRFDGTNWVEEAKLLASDGAGSDRFGKSVSVSGDVAVVGTEGDDNGHYSGSAYVYRFDGTNWVEETKLLASDGTTSDYFGISVSVSGDVVVVGAYGDDNGSFDSGSAYVYRFDGTDWVEEAKLLASDGAAEDLFGISVSVSGDVAVVGAEGDDDNGDHSGSAYAYRFDGTNWVEEAKLLASDGTRSDLFGISVSLSGDVAVVGAYGDDDSGDGSGSAYVFSSLSATPECGDGRDNDGDGEVDLDDPGCSVALDTSEHSGLLLCDDGLDNDGDDLVDFPADPGCADLSDQWEEYVCEDGIDNDGDGLIDYPHDPGCGDASDSSENSPLLVCDDGIDNDGDGLIDYPADPGCTDASDASENQAGLACDDGLDNDADGLTDYPADPGCAAAASPREDPQCQDGVDNDGDGLIDYPADPGCESAWGFVEDPACRDGIDNDGDGLIDYPADPGCGDVSDSSENSPLIVCDDGVDNDGDGMTDYDAGLSANGFADPGGPDPQCVSGGPWWNCEDVSCSSSRCGLGAELALLLAPLIWLHRRCRRAD